jgi:hypothetical protein
VNGGAALQEKQKTSKTSGAQIRKECFTSLNYNGEERISQDEGKGKREKGRGKR